ncbi:hypothetical protein PHMEG_00015321 [Phytophthora megakarya]|uniref:Uncharacterized protein n=1 Tax=Phytophthora megakarya TaxID=4795 RepID=A0A225W1R4_9STRA|nr:hypothetical protein PHMEG_00015321 [Phytophthora megakarya]
MTPRIATPYTRQNNKPNTCPNVFTNKKEMAVINWEHVLVPISFLNDQLGLAANIEMAVMRYQNSQDHRHTLHAIEDGIMELLAETMRRVNGPVFIVSEYPTSYVELVSSLFFPRLTAALRSSTDGIYVVGTPNTQLSSGELPLWKVNVLRTAIFEHLFAGASREEAINLLKSAAPGSIKVLALCANFTDAAAVSAVHSIAPNATLQLQTVEHLLCSSFRGQLDLLLQYVKTNTGLLQRTPQRNPRRQSARSMPRSKNRR